MKKTSIQMDEITKKSLDAYCVETGSQLSEAIRKFIKQGLENHAKNKTLGYQNSIGPDGLMVNQKYAIRASIEGTLLLRELAKSNLNDQSILDKIDAEVSKIMKTGWQYDNQAGPKHSESQD